MPRDPVLRFVRVEQGGVGCQLSYGKADAGIPPVFQTAETPALLSSRVAIGSAVQREAGSRAEVERAGEPLAEAL